MRYEMKKPTKKPKDWPANAIECQLDNIHIQIGRFKKEPNYKNKEVLISLISDYDLNQRSMIGLLRTTEYEVACINSLYVDAHIHQINGLKTYLYELVGNKARMQKVASWFPEGSTSLEIEEFQGLFPQLKLYYYSYLQFTVEKNKDYALHLVDAVEEIITYSKENDKEELFQETVASITQAYISLLNDISYFRCKKRTGIWAFSREEIFLLFQLAAKLIKLNGDLPTVRPLKGVLMTSISNYILKSRNDYNEDYVCKYLSAEVAQKSIHNHQIWMSVIEKLNDDREQRVVPELFEEMEWNSFDWARDIDFKPTRKYYVSSFCKSMNDAKMRKEYGECVYGYKDDRLAELLAPTILRKVKKGKAIPVLSQVVAFDVIYDREEAKEEIEFLCRIIDCFDIEDNDKKAFLEEILQYWILSVKDPKWAYERERRYVLFLYDDYEYIEIDTNDNNYLKMKTSLFIEPDFVLGKNPVKSYIRLLVDEKRYSISTKQYMFCGECLNRDFDVVTGITPVDTCPLCGSKNIWIENP